MGRNRQSSPNPARRECGAPMSGLEPLGKDQTLHWVRVYQTGAAIRDRPEVRLRPEMSLILVTALGDVDALNACNEIAAGGIVTGNDQRVDIIGTAWVGDAARADGFGKWQPQISLG